MPPAADLQALTLRTFTLLHSHKQDWPGSLILSLGLGPQGAAVALASNLAGAVCLSLEEDPATAHAALRSGACDFIVNTLDEALRALKNEVRKHLPISVGLQGNRAGLLAELLERGVVPQLVTDSTADPANIPAFETFVSQGSTQIDFSSDAALSPFLLQRGWTAETFHLPTAAALREFDTQAATLLPPDDTLRRSWLNSARRLFPRERPPTRTLWVTPQEMELLQKS
jgi:urocanate hydratase